MTVSKGAKELEEGEEEMELTDSMRVVAVAAPLVEAGASPLKT
jgi:hypothetical protein